MSSLIPGLQEEPDLGEEHEVNSGTLTHSEISSNPSGQAQGQHSQRLDGHAQILEKSRASQLFEDMLTTCYTPMEVWYARSVIDKVLLVSSLPDRIVTHETVNRLTDCRLMMYRNTPFQPRRLMTHFTS